MSSSSEEDEGKPTDCCGATISDDIDTEECPDCGHVTCQDCEVSTSRGRCWCKYSIRGDAVFDQMTQDSRNFASSISGYSGPFKALYQVRMEKDLLGGWNSSKSRVDKCGYRNCTTQLTDENVGEFLLCDKCRSVAYCSEICREEDAKNATHNGYDEEPHKHGDLCEPYRDNEKFPYIGFALRKYKENFGHFPHPLGLDASDGSEKKRKRGA